MKIANAVIEMAKSNVELSNIQIKSNDKISFHTPRGYVHSMETFTKEDVEDFADFSSPKWRELIEKEGGQFDVGFNLANEKRLRCHFSYGGGDRSLNVSVRLQPLKIPEFNSLGVPAKLLNLIKHNVQGLIVISGPTGSGKTTTQFSLINEINKTDSRHISTLEQPIEFVLNSDKSVISQRQVPGDVSSFDLGIKSIMRQHASVIMIGEIRDKETVASMLDAATSGHLVIAGTHAESADTAVESLLRYYDGAADVQGKRNQLASSLLAINSQRLLPSRDGKRNIMAYDLLVNNPMVAKLIREGNSAGIPALMSSQNKGESIRLNDVLADKVKSGQISINDAFKAAKDVDALSNMLGGQRPSM